MVWVVLVVIIFEGGFQGVINRNLQEIWNLRSLLIRCPILLICLLIFTSVLYSFAFLVLFLLVYFALGNEKEL